MGQLFRSSLLAALGAAVLSLGSVAFAGQEAPCADQYSLEEQLMLEFAALGGDPHAQFALAQCALPERTKKLSPQRMSYALTWVTLAACDAMETDHLEARDRRTRRLKAQGDLSFRRFVGANDKEEDYNRKEKRFVTYRNKKITELSRRMKRLERMASTEEIDAARNELSERFARFGALGQVRLASLSSCPHLHPTDAFVAASWSSAADALGSLKEGQAKVYGPSDMKDWSVQEEADVKLAALEPQQRQSVAFEKDQLSRYDNNRIDNLESEAALGRLANLQTLQGLPVGQSASDVSNVSLQNKTTMNAASFGLASADQADRQSDILNVAYGDIGYGSAGSDAIERVAGPSVAIAIQYALEALGFIKFENGPDNDYGTSTVAAVAKAQEQFGKPSTRWLSQSDVTEFVCRAAMDAADPVSYYHLSVMYLRGQGFRKNIDKARFAITQAEELLEGRLADSDQLDEWKVRQYPAVRDEIGSVRSEADNEWSVLPDTMKRSQSAWRVSGERLCL
ncbi:MAG: hypothetical protein AAGH38_10680 [Pseudomonadota bacterium]